MTVKEIKTDFHSLIDSFNDAEALSQFYSLMKTVKEAQKGSLWNWLSVEEQNELLSSDDESRDENQLIANEELKKKHAKWLK